MGVAYGLALSQNYVVYKMCFIDLKLQEKVTHKEFFSESTMATSWSGKSYIIVILAFS